MHADITYTMSIQYTLHIVTHGVKVVKSTTCPVSTSNQGCCAPGVSGSGGGTGISSGGGGGSSTVGCCAPGWPPGLLAVEATLESSLHDVLQLLAYRAGVSCRRAALHVHLQLP